MAVAPPLSAFEIVDLRMLSARSLAALFEEEQRHWRQELYWDYRASVEMIRKHVEAHSLPGYVALRQGSAVGYCFFVYEEEKGLLGDLYVLEAHRRRPYEGSAGIATLLLQHALETLEHAPPVRRIEAQLIPFGTEPLTPVFLAHNFCSFPRLFMYKQLNSVRQPGRYRSQGSLDRLGGAMLSDQAAELGAELRPWDDSCFEPMAELIVNAYEGHADRQINDHYTTSSGALRFLKNVVLFPGCGLFQPDASLVAVRRRGEAGLPVFARRGRLLGAVLTSQVARGIAHITQICVRRQWQGRGLGRRLLETALQCLAAKRYRGVSLTVTAENRVAVGLYRRLGFEVTKEFVAFARDLR